jgi:hypothetical protein
MQVTSKVSNTEVSQAPGDPRAATQFKVGVSGNPTGHQRSRALRAEFLAAFQARHHRPPSPVELVDIRSAAKLAAVAEGPRTTGDGAVRANNALHRVLSRLGLAKPPAKRVRQRFPTMDEIRARRSP